MFNQSRYYFFSSVKEQAQGLFGDVVVDETLACAYTQLLNTTSKQNRVWGNGATGWAPKEVAALLLNSRLDRQLALVKSLKQWICQTNLSEGDLILAWANLGAVIEGCLKLFVVLYLNDYLSSEYRFFASKKKSEVKRPDGLKFDELIQLVGRKKENIVDDEVVVFLQRVQNNRNAIHAFKERKLDDFEKFKEYVVLTAIFTYEMDLSHPPEPDVYIQR